LADYEWDGLDPFNFLLGPDEFSLQTSLFIFDVFLVNQLGGVDKDNLPLVAKGIQDHVGVSSISSIYLLRFERVQMKRMMHSENFYGEYQKEVALTLHLSPTCLSYSQG
jgi:hypothetical protein